MKEIEEVEEIISAHMDIHDAKRMHSRHHPVNT